MFDFTITSDKKLLKEISRKLDKLLERKDDETVEQLEKQMDGWLLSLDTALGKIEQVSKKV